MAEYVIMLTLEGPEDALNDVAEIVENEMERLAFEHGCKVVD